MNARRHSLLARNLIKACGGAEEAEKASRLKQSQLYNAANANHDAVLPVDVIADLEAYAGDALYSRAMVEACEDISPSGDLVGEAIDLNAKLATLSSHLHHAMADKIITPNEANQLSEMAQSLRQGLARIDADISELCASPKTGAKKNDSY